MSSDLADFYDQKRRNKAADREQDRLDRQVDREQNRVDAQARLDLKAKQRREELAEAKRRKAERAKKWADRRAAVTDWLSTDADTAMVLPIMAVGMVAAITFQVDALTDAGFGRIFGGLPVMVALVLELGAAAATVMTVRAAKDGRPVGPFRTAMWTCALIAAGINAAHGWTMEIDGERAYWPAAVLFVVSLAGTGYWEMRSIGRHGTSRRTKEERAKDKARAKHAKDRAKTYEDVADRAREIVLANPFGAVTVEKAWADAWTDIKGAPLGMYAEVYENRGKAQAATTKARAVADEAAMAAGLDTFLDSLLGGGPKGDDDPGASSAKRGPKSPPKTPTALGGLGKRSSGRAPRKDATEPLEQAHIDKARELLNLIGEDKFSAPEVAKLLGRSNVYARRIRNAVTNPEGDQ